MHTIIDLKSKIYESAIDPDVILYHHTHSTYNACLKILMIYFQGTFYIYVKVDEIYFYRKSWVMHWYYDFIKNSSTSLRVRHIDV